MIKIQELEIDGEIYRLREPRLRDYMASRDKKGSESTVAMLGGMVLGADGKEIGQEAALDLPLRVFDKLNDALNKMLSPEGKPKVPLAPEIDSSSDSPSVSEEQSPN